MRRMMSPKPNRKGEHEVHSVPSRMAARMERQGWTEVQDDKPLTESLSRRKQFDLSGPWLKVRARVRDELNIKRVPKDKAEARYLLEDAGYEVVEG